MSEDNETPTPPTEPQYGTQGPVSCLFIAGGIVLFTLGITAARVAHFLSTSEGANLMQHIRESASQIFSQ